MKSIIKNAVVAIITWEAKLVLKKYRPKIVAVTGNVGKTSTKDAIFSVLSRFFYVRKSQKSFNSEIGVPLTILGCPSGWSSPVLWLKNILDGLVLIFLPNRYPEWLVLEIGADRPGDIQSISEWIKPDIAVFSKMSKIPVHVEFFASVEEVFKEKAFLAAALKREGILVLNADDEDILSLRNTTEEKVVLYGTGNGADVIGSDLRLIYEEKEGSIRFPSGVSFKVASAFEEGEAIIRGGLGVQQMYPALAALAVGLALDLPLAKLLSALREHEPTPGRMRVLPGLKNTVIIDDSYNSSPIALEHALNTLKSLDASGGRKIAVLGDMLELGTYSSEAHKQAGKLAAESADLLFTVGLRARGIAEGALEALMDEGAIFQYEDAFTAGNDLEIMLREGDMVLIKGSQGMRMERVVEEIMAEPEKKTSFLVRQDKEWEGR